MARDATGKSEYLDGLLKASQQFSEENELSHDPKIATETELLNALNEKVDALGVSILDEPIPQAIIASIDAAMIKLSRRSSLTTLTKARNNLITRGEQSALGVRLVSGWAAPYQLLEDGRQTLVHVHVPGDVIIFRKPDDLTSALSVQALTDVVARPIAEEVTADDHQYWTLSRLLLNERSLLMDRIVSLGRRSAMQRIAHFCLELQVRVEAHRGEKQNELALPLSQVMIGDLLGLSSVHVNKTLAKLRKDKMIHVERGRIKILDRASLEALAEFQSDESD